MSAWAKLNRLIVHSTSMDFSSYVPTGGSHAIRVQCRDQRRLEHTNNPLTQNVLKITSLRLLDE
jgi:hypothetical protein